MNGRMRRSIVLAAGAAAWLAAAAGGAWAEGGGTLRLDGRRGYAAPHCKALDLADAVTMEAWIKPGRDTQPPKAEAPKPKR